jgi:hypothetical protein
MYASPSLTAHLSALSSETREKTQLIARITTLIHNTTTRQAAHTLLDAEFAALPPDLDPEATKTYKSLASKLATLRELQHQATRPLRMPQFTTHIVTGTGGPAVDLEPLTKISLPCSIGWEEYADVLAEYIHRALADIFGDGEAKGDEWFYQLPERDMRFRELGCEGDFRRMRREMGRGGVMVWDVSIFLFLFLFFFLLGLVGWWGIADA